MTRKLKIIEQDEWFLNSSKSERGKYFLSYKLVFLYSLHRGVHSQQITINDFINVTKQSIKAIQNDTDFRCNCFSLYLIATTKAFLFIDHMHGCFPLILDSNDDEFKELSALRKSAAIQSLKDIDDKSDSLYRLLSETQTWDQALQDQIIKEIPDPNTEDLDL